MMFIVTYCIELVLAQGHGRERRCWIGNSFCQDWAEGGLGKFHFALFTFFTPIVDAQTPLL